MTKFSETLPPALADLDAMARETLDLLPTALLRFADDVLIRTVDFPDDDVCEEMKLETPFDILGLYQGTSIDEKKRRGVGRPSRHRAYLSSSDFGFLVRNCGGFTTNCAPRPHSRNRAPFRIF
jgi:predicted Zn-dependent protease with MMP-like domain